MRTELENEIAEHLELDPPISKWSRQAFRLLNAALGLIEGLRTPIVTETAAEAMSPNTLYIERDKVVCLLLAAAWPEKTAESIQDQIDALPTITAADIAPVVHKERELHLHIPPGSRLKLVGGVAVVEPVSYEITETN